jgi:Fe-Mn family superoxide dismutase
MEKTSTIESFNRRDALTALGALGLGAVANAVAQPAGTPAPAAPTAGASPLSLQDLGWDAAKGEYTLPPLPYPKDALEPHLDAQTMEIHHGKHHKAYVDGLNKALKALADVRAGTGDAGLVKHWSREVSFHGSGHVNHSLFWRMMAPTTTGGGGKPSGTLGEAIARDFGSFEAFVTHFKAAANQVEGSGWAWLVYEPIAKRLLVIQGEKQQNLMLTGVFPVLGIDVWEHAYYLKYQNKRADYVAAFLNVINWSYCQKLFDRASA